jgi:hypothetical protein
MMSLGERILLGAAACSIFLWVGWAFVSQAVVSNMRLQAELARCQQAAASPAPAPAPAPATGRR